MSHPPLDDTFRAIIRAAVQSNASDIHLKPGSPPMVRIEGELVPVEAPVPTDAWLRVVLRGMTPPHLVTQFEQVHEADFAFTYQDLRFRVNIYQQRGHPTIAMRLVKTVARDFDELNLPPQIGDLASKPRGIVIIGGATGSGKSTTLAAMIEHVNKNERRHILTIEDPIEFLFTDKESIIEQREIGIDTDSYSAGLRHVLRQDPDVIVIGEMRDAESAHAAMSAANIGRLVFTTLHTSDATASIQRVLEFFPTSERDFARRLFAETLTGIVCQRLVHTDTGALPATEILMNSPSIARLIAEEKLDKIRGALELGGPEGMQTFDQDLTNMVKEGKITRDEAIINAANPELLRMAFQGVVVSESQRILQSRS
jgi:twitching motility protein PilT